MLLNDFSFFLQTNLIFGKGKIRYLVDSISNFGWKKLALVLDAGPERNVLWQEIEKEISKKYFYPPLHRQTIYSAIYESQKKQLNNTDSISNRVVSLPIYSRLLDEEVNKICNAIERIKQFSSEIKETISSLCV